MTLSDDTTTATVHAPTTKDAERESKLGNLKARRQEVLAAQVLVRRVPRWSDPYVFVRYGPIDHGIIRAGYARIDNAAPGKKSKVEMEVNSDLLVKACQAVWAQFTPDEEDADRFSLRPDDPHGEPTRFDKDLATNLGLDEEATARAVVKELFILDGDVLAHARAVAEFSGYREKEADDESLGE